MTGTGGQFNRHMQVVGERARELPSVLARARLGLIGLGRIGGRVAKIGRALGMDVVAWTPHLTPERVEQKGARSPAPEELPATSMNDAAPNTACSAAIGRYPVNNFPERRPCSPSLRSR